MTAEVAVCERKHKMGPTRARNVAVALRLADADVQPYLCDVCDCWHVGDVREVL